jgi:hypothetical protein
LFNQRLPLGGLPAPQLPDSKIDVRHSRWQTQARRVFDGQGFPLTGDAPMHELEALYFQRGDPGAEALIDQAQLLLPISSVLDRCLHRLPGSPPGGSEAESSLRIRPGQGHSTLAQAISKIGQFLPGPGEDLLVLLDLALRPGDQRTVDMGRVGDRGLMEWIALEFQVQGVRP